MVVVKNYLVNRPIDHSLGDQECDFHYDPHACSFDYYNSQRNNTGNTGTVHQWCLDQIYHTDLSVQLCNLRLGIDSSIVSSCRNSRSCCGCGYFRGGTMDIT